MNTIFKFSLELEELVGRKWQMAPNRMFLQLTDKTKKKKHCPFYEAVDAHAHRHLTMMSGTRDPTKYIRRGEEGMRASDLGPSENQANHLFVQV